MGNPEQRGAAGQTALNAADVIQEAERVLAAARPGPGDEPVEASDIPLFVQVVVCAVGVIFVIAVLLAGLLWMP